MREWITSEFWENISRQTFEWIVTISPSILLIILLAGVGLKAVDAILHRVRKIVTKQLKPANEVDSIELEKRMDTLVGILRSSLKIVLWAMVLMLLLRRLGIDVAPLIAGAGIAGLAIGFGAQELVRDVISGFFILLEDQIRAGDVAAINGTGGLVESIGLRTVVLRDQTGTVHVFQNGKINTLSNMTKGWSAAVFDIGVAYKEDTDRVIETMKEVAEELRADPEFGPNILEPMEVFGVDAFGESAVVIKSRLKTLPIKQWFVGREYRSRLKKAFDVKGIEIPFPQRTVYQRIVDERVNKGKKESVLQRDES